MQVAFWWSGLLALTSLVLHLVGHLLLSYVLLLALKPAKSMSGRGAARYTQIWPLLSVLYQTCLTSANARYSCLHLCCSDQL